MRCRYMARFLSKHRGVLFVMLGLLICLVVRHVFFNSLTKDKEGDGMAIHTGNRSPPATNHQITKVRQEDGGKGTAPEDTMKDGSGQSSLGRGTLIRVDGTGLEDKVKAMFRENGLVLFSVINDAFLEMAGSWCCNTRFFAGLHKRVVFHATDVPTAQRLRFFCPDVTVAVTSTASDSDHRLSGVLNYMTAGYVRLVVERYRLVLRLLEAGVQLLQFEVDFVWFKDPIPVVLKYQASADIVVSKSGNNQSDDACSCFLFLNPTATTLRFWRRYVELMAKLYQDINKHKETQKVRSLHTQGFMNNLIREKYAEVRITYLPYEDFADGKWYQWPRERQKKLDPYFIHNNWIVGEPAKRIRAQAYGHWFWDAAANRCNSSALRLWNL